MKNNKEKELENFKCLLRYFIIHLEYCHNGYSVRNDWPQSPYVEKFLEIIKKGNKVGQGYRGGKIQEQIEDWCGYSVGKINISVQHSPKGGYTTIASYLHWDGTGLNINAQWRKGENIIDYLYFRNADDESSNDTYNDVASVNRDDVFSENIDSIKKLFDVYVNAKKNALSYKKDRIKELLRNNFNLILTGAPGTGKTYLARQIAAAMIDCTEKELNERNQFGFVQFHPSYDYTDFVEGLRPDKNDKDSEVNVKFKRIDGVFKAFCKNAVNDEGKNFVFVIDEINRGEISKIFGELFFSIDPGYRKEEDRILVETQYQNLLKDTGDLFEKGFYVPENVYVIGTMNDIDRSVESMDFAFRRRFSFVEVTASESESIIYSQQEKEWDDNIKKEAVSRMRKLNAAIINPNIGNLSEQYQIGGSYFLKLAKNGFNFKRLWKENLYGVLFEYYRGNPDAKVIVDKLEDAYNLK